MSDSSSLSPDPGESSATRAIPMGPGQTLVPEDLLYTNWSGYYSTLQNFRSFYQALGVPYIETQSGHRLVWLEVFQIALATCTQIGSPNFLSPSCPSRNKQRLPKHYAYRLTPETFKDQWQEALNLMMFTRRADFKSRFAGAPGKAAMELAADRLATALARMTFHTYHGVTEEAKRDGIRLPPVREARAKAPYGPPKEEV